MTSTRSRENTRARLVSAAEEVFAERGIRRVTVDDLVNAAGYTRGAFYSNFSSIEEVFFELFRTLSQQMLDAVETTLEQTPEGEFTIGLVLEAVQPISRRWYAIQAECTVMALRSEQARTIFREQEAQFRGQMMQVIADVVDRLGRVPALPMEQLAETAIALYLHALMQESLGLETFDVAQLTETVLPHVILGLSTEK